MENDIPIVYEEETSKNDKKKPDCVNRNTFSIINVIHYPFTNRTNNDSNKIRIYTHWVKDLTRRDKKNLVLRQTKFTRMRCEHSNLNIECEKKNAIIILCVCKWSGSPFSIFTLRFRPLGNCYIKSRNGAVLIKFTVVAES